MMQIHPYMFLATIAVNGQSVPSMHAELIQQGIFRPLRFNGTLFLVTESIHDVIPPLNPPGIVCILPLVPSVMLNHF